LLKRQRRINCKNLRMEEDDYIDIVANDANEVGIVRPGEENVIALEELEEDTCPECGSPLAYVPISDNRMGVGQTYDQTKMNPFTIFYDVLCQKCGLVVKHATHEVHR